MPTTAKPLPGSIALSDPGFSNRIHRDEIQAAIQRVMDSGRYVLGPEVENFEREFAAYVGTAHALGVAQGTDALLVGMLALGIGPGDAVLTVSHTALASVAAIHRTGATPVLVDVTPEDGLMDAAAVSRELALIEAGRGVVPKGTVKAILVVHLYGAAADIKALAEIAAGAGLHLIEDCAQAHGARVGERRVGQFGVFGAFSFYPTKNLGAPGDAGAVVTSDTSLAEAIRRIRQYGWTRPQFSERPGLNSRLDEIHAAVLRCKLPQLDQSNDIRRAIAHRYISAFANSGLLLPVWRDNAHVFHQFVLRSRRRDVLAAFLAGHGIQTAVHYATPVHQQPGYAGYCRVAGSDLPQTDRWAATALSLPVHPGLTAGEVERIIAAVLAWNEEEN